MLSEAASFFGVNQSTPLRTSAVSDDNGTTGIVGSVTIASAPGDLVYDFTCHGTQIDALNSQSGAQTFLDRLVGGSSYSCDNIAASMKAGAGSASMHWDYSGNDYWTDFASSIEPAHGTILKPPNNLGLVGYWSFDEGTSTTAHDFSGNKNNGTLTGSTLPAWVNGKHGKALFFDDSVSGYIPIGGSKAYAPSTSPFTFSVWVNINKFTAANSYLPEIATLRTDTTNPLYILIGGPLADTRYTGITVCNVASDAAWTTGFHSNVDPTPLVGSWHHIVLTFNGANATMNGNFTTYLDGVTQPSTGTSGCVADPVGEETVIGSYNNGASAWDGKLDDVRIYNRALSASQVAGLYQSGAVKINTSSVNLQSGSSLASGLVGLWTFDGADTTDKIYDRSGQGNNGYFVGGATSSAKTIGKLGQALNFDGANNFVDVAPSASLNNIAQLTYSAWINPRSSGSNDKGRIIDKNHLSADGVTFLVNNNDCTKCLEFNMGASAGNTVDVYTSDNAYAVNAGWQHVVVTWDGTYSLSGVKFYVNGVFVPNNSGISVVTGSGARDDSTISLDIGGFNGGPRYFDGKIDDVRVYNRALSANEVQHLYLLGGTRIVK